jgi:capsular exopolysaccharide synthesis family protein
MIVGIITTLPMVVTFVVSRQPKVYETSASMVVDNNVPQYLGQQFRDVVDIESSWWSAQETMQTELKILRSHTQAAATARALCEKRLGEGTALDKIAPKADCRDERTFETAAEVIQHMVRIEPTKDSTRVVFVYATSTDPQYAALMANTFVQVYSQRNLERRLAQSEGAATWLGDEYGDLTAQLNDAEKQLIEFKKKYGVVAVPIEDQQNDIATRRRKLAEELNNVEVRLIALKSQREQFLTLNPNDPLNDITPGVADSPVMVKLKELYVDQYAKLVELRGKYLDKHPTVLAQEGRVDAIKNDLINEVKLAARNAEAQYQALVKQQKDLRAALDAATHEALQLEQRAIDYNRLKRNFDRLSKLSEQVGGRERETSLAGHLKTNNVRVLDAALVPARHISPNVMAALGSSLGIAIVLAFGIALLLELLDSTIKNQDDIEKVVGVSFLGVIPQIDPEPNTAKIPPGTPQNLQDIIQAGSRDLFVLGHPRSSVSECCRAIRTNLLFMTPDTPARSVLITSAGPQEGKTTTAVSMAITFAQSGRRVLLVDTDMRRPRLHKAFGIPASPDGVSRAIVGEINAMSVVVETGIPNLYLLPCGATPPNPAELLHADRFKQIINELLENFDRVIFDSPPVGAVTDASILARVVDGTVLVAKGSQTSKDALIRAKRLLSAAGINVLGCILNSLDIRKPGSYGYYYYSRYGYYAGYQGTGKSETEKSPPPPPAAPPSGPLN